MSDAFVRRVFGIDPDRVVLASRSPRRRELLERLGFRAEVLPADVDERVLPGESVAGHVERLALEKADAVSPRRPGRLVIAADTVVVLGDRVLGKPADPDEARRMLEALSGRTHEVVTACAVAHDGDREVGRELTHVTFRALEPGEIDAYVASGEPDDKAGAYGAQALGATFVSRFDGCYYNVVGLPIVRLLALVRALLGHGPQGEEPSP